MIIDSRLLLALPMLFVIVAALPAAIGLIMPGRRSLFAWSLLSGTGNVLLVGLYGILLYELWLPLAADEGAMATATLAGAAVLALAAGSAIGIVMRRSRLRGGAPKQIAPAPPSL